MGSVKYTPVRVTIIDKMAIGPLPRRAVFDSN